MNSNLEKVSDNQWYDFAFVKDSTHQMKEYCNATQNDIKQNQRKTEIVEYL